MDYASNITFEGITFSHTTWTHPSEYEYNDQQANCYYEGNKWIQVPAGMLLTGTKNITFDDCDLTNMGTAGLKIKSTGDGTADGNSVINSRIHDIGYSGIIVGEVYGHHGYQSYMLVKNTTIKNNYDAIYEAMKVVDATKASYHATDYDDYSAKIANDMANIAKSLRSCKSIEK